MTEKRYLFDDGAMRDFVVRGYALVQADLPTSFHREIYQKLEGVLEKEGNPGNNILPRLPGIQQVFDTPSVRGALTSILGPGYTMHPHRYCHLNRPGSGEQKWHKDDYIFDQNVRHHRFRWVMAFYYPQDVTEDMGPTGVAPGRQYYNAVSDVDPAQSTEQELTLCGPAGTVAIVNFDSWHRATANRSDQKRYMLKFQFLRMEEPREPSWNGEQAAWQPVDHDRHSALSMNVWDWLNGNGATSGKDAPVSSTSGKGSVPHLIGALRDKDEAVRLDAAYALGAMGERVVEDLLAALHAEAAARAESNLPATRANPQGGNPAELCSAYALSAVGSPAVPALIAELKHAHWAVRAAAADILGNLGWNARQAIPALIRALRDENAWVRRNAAEALGTIGSPAVEAVPALRERLKDEDERIRRNAAFTLARIGRPAHEAVPGLIEILTDESRYTRFYAALALRQIGTPEAHTALWDDLQTSRWCPLTTRETPY